MNEVKMARHSKRKLFAIIIAAVVVVIIYTAINEHNFAWYNNKKIVGSHPCMTPEVEMNDLKSLASDSHAVMDEFKLTHFLVYGSLWGALRYKDPLPWDNDFDMGLLQDEMQHINEDQFLQAFKKKNINIYYRYWLGTYRVTRGKARGDLMVFRKTYLSDDMCRTGLEPWFFFVNHNRYHRFPSRLVKQPLPRVKFAGTDMPVPHEGVEIQKHFYPHDWQTETKPSGCS